MLLNEILEVQHRLSVQATGKHAGKGFLGCYFRTHGRIARKKPKPISNWRKTVTDKNQWVKKGKK